MATTKTVNKTFHRCLLLLSVALLSWSPAAAEETLTVAVAANFIRPMEELTSLVHKGEGIKVVVTYGSSGKLFAQLKHGAPYDLFLSADQHRPELLHAQGLCSTPFHYAEGSVVLWSGDRSLQATSWQEALTHDPGRIAIASPEAAPYGGKAMQALEETGMARQLLPRLIYGQSVGQTFLFVQSGSTKFGFVALSQALSAEGKKGQFWPMPEADTVQQDGCIPRQGKNTAQRLQVFLTSETARKVIKAHGYQ